MGVTGFWLARYHLLSELDEQELRRRYYERLCHWSEPGAVKVYRDGRLLGPLVELGKWMQKI